MIKPIFSVLAHAEKQVFFKTSLPQLITVLDHNVTTVVLLSMPYARSISHSRLMLDDRSTEHGRPLAIAVDYRRSAARMAYSYDIQFISTHILTYS